MDWFARVVKYEREYRKAHGLSQKEYGRKYGFSQTTISDFERMESIPGNVDAFRRMVNDVLTWAEEEEHDRQAKPTVMLCPTCGEITPKGGVHGAEYCVHCGTRACWECPKCQEFTEVHNEFCGHCGKPRPEGIEVVTTEEPAGQT